MKENVENLFGNYWRVSKILTWFFDKEDLGLITAVLLGEFINKREYLRRKKLLPKDEMFYYEQKDIEKFTKISEYKQRKCLELLVSCRFISTEKRGIPSRIFYKINDKLISQTILNFNITSIPEYYDEIS